MNAQGGICQELAPILEAYMNNNKIRFWNNAIEGEEGTLSGDFHDDPVSEIHIWRGSSNWARTASHEASHVVGHGHPRAYEIGDQCGANFSAV